MRRALPILAALLLALPAFEAAAQGMIRGPQQQPRGPGPAPALPGLAGRTAPAPIEGDPAANLSPNAALFDAINRGDIAAVREAIGRGASVDARNRLGLTPIDAAVDQGRTEIAFYLLSARDVARTPPPPPPGVGLAEPPVTPTPRSPARRETVAATPAPAAPAAPRGARLWAGDGGAPRPEIGFLGFDAGRPAGAVPPVEPARRVPGRG